MSLLDALKATLGKAAKPQPQQAQQAAAAQAVADVSQAATGKAAAPTPSPVSQALLAAQQSVKDQAQQQQSQAQLANAQVLGQAEAVEKDIQLGQAKLTAQAQQAQAAQQAQVLEAGKARAAQAQDFQARQAAAREAFARDLASKNYQVANRLATERGITTDDLFAEHSAGVQELAFRRDAAILEQKAHVLALADKEYVRNLTQIGETRRLREDLAYKAEVQRVVLGDTLNDLFVKQNHAALLNANQREFDEYLATLDADTALAILQKQARDATAASAVTNAGTAAQGIASNYKREDSKAPKITEDKEYTKTSGASNTAPGSSTKYSGIA